MSLTAANGSQFYIGDGSSYTAVGSIESIGDFGPSSEAKSQSSSDSATDFGFLTYKAKGARDYGTVEITVAIDPDDAGQIAMRSAEEDETGADFPFRIRLQGPYGYLIFEFVGKVMAARNTIGAVDNIVRTVFPVAINSKLTISRA